MDVRMRDLWRYPITIVDGANQIAMSETSGGGTASIPPGTYWAYLDDSTPAAFLADYPSFYEALETAVNAATSGTYHLEIATPGSSSDFVNAGLQWAKDSGPAQLGFDVDEAGFTLPPELLGLGPGSEGLRTPPHVSEYSRWGVWHSPRPRSSANAGEKAIQFSNRASRETKQVRRWRTDRTRLVDYHWVHAGHIRDRANAEQSFADGARLALGDHGNYLYDLWAQGLSRHQDILVTHRVHEDDVDLDLFGLGEGWEIVSVLEDRDAQDFESLLTLEERTGAHYGVDLLVWSRAYDSILAAYPDVADTYYRRGV